jgi:hypothetical protein
VLSGDVLRPFLHELLNKANVQATPSVAARYDPLLPPPPPSFCLRVSMYVNSEAGAVGDVPREAIDVLWKLCSQVTN